MVEKTLPSFPYLLKMIIATTKGTRFMNRQTEILNELSTISEKLSCSIAELKELACGDEAQAQPEQMTYSKEEVRQFLAGLAGKGHRDEVKDLLKKYGVASLGAIDPKHYADLMADAEVIGNE